MLTSSLQNALLFTISTFFNIYIIIVLFRLMIQFARADIYNPFAQFSIKATNPLLTPLRKIFPKIGSFDLAALVLALLLATIQQVLFLLVKGFAISPSPVAIGCLFLWGAGELIDLILVFLLIATFIQVIFSWIPTGHYNPVASICAQITRPLYSPLRRLLPNTGPIDFTPMLIIFLIILTRMLVAEPVIYLGKSSYIRYGQ